MTGLASTVGAVADKVLSRFIEDPTQRQQAQLAIQKALLDERGEFLKAQRDVIVAEASSEGTLARNWRPITMLVFVSIIANNYIIAPYVALFFGVDVILELPARIWDIIGIGLGGYVAGRSGEKIAKSYFDAQKDK